MSDSRAAAQGSRPDSSVLEHPQLMSAADVLSALGSSLDGLSTDEATARLKRLGPNALPEQKARSVAAMMVDQFKDFLVLLLLGAAVISGMLGEVADTIAILVIVVLNAIIGVVQEYRAQRAMEALRKMAAETASVRRDGHATEVPAEELTIGDIVLLDAGRIVPADMRLVEVATLRAAEAALTGESMPVEKTVTPSEKPDAPVGDRYSMAFKGTQVVHGRGIGVVTSVGLGTELGKIAHLLGAQEEVKTPLQKRLAQFGKLLGIAALALCAVVFAVGVLRGEDVLVMFLTAVSLAVAAVPEALPAVATISLAFGARRLVRAHTLVRKLPAVEALGSVTYICTDKTGTLTMNVMTVERTAPGPASGTVIAREGGTREEPLDESSIWLGRAMALSNDVAGKDDSLIGDPTEVALYVSAAGSGFDRTALQTEFPRVAELPFDSERKLMTTIHRVPDGGYVAFTKGAAEVVLGRSTAVMRPDGSLAPLDLQAAADVVDTWSADGLRVLAFGMRRLDDLPADPGDDSVERDLVVIGYTGLVDPPRAEAAGAVRTCANAGIIPVMITGDHPSTALAIARRLGIAESKSR